MHPRDCRAELQLDVLFCFTSAYHTLPDPRGGFFFLKPVLASVQPLHVWIPLGRIGSASLLFLSRSLPLSPPHSRWRESAIQAGST